MHIIGETFNSHALLPIFLWIKFCSSCFFSFGEQKKVTGRIRQMVVLYSKDCLRIGLGGLSIGSLR